MEIPTYILTCLKKYGNTIITRKDLKKLGGKEKFLERLEEEHKMQCILKDPTSDREHKQKRCSTYSHYVVMMKWRIN